MPNPTEGLLYKGYFITTSTEGRHPPYAATFGYAKALPDGTTGQIEIVGCGNDYRSVNEAHQAANKAAHRHIDLLTE